ncbi:MAG: NAD(P)/FAD-dependent oxidoreductase [Elusimicrobia bacterium]|nr:NAD(P)/FAD-dependent oxidoreductase [Elusimicrobiota bacterium]
MEKINVTIIGGGVVGCAIAMRLAEKGKDVFLFEKNPYLGDEQSGRNSGVIHAGIYYDREPLKQKLCVRGKHLLYEFCEKFKVAAVKTGKFIVAVDENDDSAIERYFEHTKKVGVLTEKATPEFVRRKEPNIKCFSALWSPTTGIVDAAGFVETLAKLAEEKGAEILKQTKVVNIEPAGDFLVTVKYKNGIEETFKTEILINSAGLYSDEIARMINPESEFEIAPVRGEYYYFNSTRPAINLNGTNIYPVQKNYFVDGRQFKAIGIHLTPTFEISETGAKISRKFLVGPTSNVVQKKEDLSENRDGPQKFFGGVKDFFPSIKPEDLKMDYAGNRAKLKKGNDFVIEKDKKYSNAINLVGIDSPGLTSALAIAEFVENLLN